MDAAGGSAVGFVVAVVMMFGLVFVAVSVVDSSFDLVVGYDVSLVA